MLGRRFSEMSTDRDRVEESVTEAKGYHTAEGYVQEIVSTAPARISSLNGEVVQVVTRRKTVTTLGPSESGGLLDTADATAPKLAYGSGISVASAAADSPSSLARPASSPLYADSQPFEKANTEYTATGTAVSRTASLLAPPPTNGSPPDFPSFYKGSQAGGSVADGDAFSPTPNAPAGRGGGSGPIRPFLDTTSPPQQQSTGGGGVFGVNATPSQHRDSGYDYAYVSPAAAPTPKHQQHQQQTTTVGVPYATGANSYTYSVQSQQGALLDSSPSRPYGTGRFVTLPQQQHALLGDRASGIAAGGESPARRSVRIGQAIDLRVIEPSRLSPIQPQPGYAPVKFITRGELRRMREERGGGGGYGGMTGTGPAANGRIAAYASPAGPRSSNWDDADGNEGGGGGYSYQYGYNSGPQQGQRQTRWSRSNSPTNANNAAQRGFGSPNYARPQQQQRPGYADPFAQQQGNGGYAYGDESGGDDHQYDGYGYDEDDGGMDFDTISIASSAHAQYRKDQSRLRQMRYAEQQRRREAFNARDGYADPNPNPLGEFPNQQIIVARDQSFEPQQQQQQQLRRRASPTAADGYGYSYGYGGGRAGYRFTYGGDRSRGVGGAHPHEYAAVESRRRSGSAASDGSNIGYNRLGVLRDGDRDRALAVGAMGPSRRAAGPPTRLRDLTRVDLDVEDVAAYLAAMRSLPYDLMPAKPPQASEAFLVATRGTYLIKYNKNSQPHERFFALRMVPDEATGRTHPYLVWALHDKSAGFKARVHLSYLMQAAATTQSQNFQRMLTVADGPRAPPRLVGPFAGAARCTVPTDFAMSFVFQSANTYRTVDAVALDEQTFRCWMIVMSYFAAINNNEGGAPVSADDVGVLALDTPRSQSAASAMQ